MELHRLDHLGDRLVAESVFRSLRASDTQDPAQKAGPLKFRTLFITGTDTGIGKTTVLSAIVAALRRQNWRVGVFKPVETGCLPGLDGRPLPQDAAQLRYFSECQLDLRSICPIVLKEPLAPLVAARREGVCIDINQIAEAHAALAVAHDLTCVEGAGGLLVPIAPGVTFADLAARLDASVVVVIGSKLGALNHALLTIRYAQAVGLCVLGYIVNFLAADADVAARTNVDVLAEWCGPPLGVVPYLGPVTMTQECRQRLADAADVHIRISELLVPC
ncbi:MAG TPA: dethiobiotin synthase [Candidatus Margulisiibacteriota bacterium]|nr:dethiobiotin synthase [Candidatus Margulisiibacteriota bacterium]